MPRKKKSQIKCPLCNSRKGKRECPRFNSTICSRCCGSERNQTECPSTCAYSESFQQEHTFLAPSEKRAYKSLDPGNTIVFFVERASNGLYTFCSLLVDRWKGGLKDAFGEKHVSEKRFLESFRMYQGRTGVNEYPWNAALTIVREGMRIRDALGYPYPPEFYQFQGLLKGLDEIKLTGSIYKCYTCEQGDLSDDVVNHILEATRIDIEAGILGQEGETMFFFECDRCASQQNDAISSSYVVDSFSTSYPSDHDIDLEASTIDYVDRNAPPDKQINQIIDELAKDLPPKDRSKRLQYIFAWNVNNPVQYAESLKILIDEIYYDRPGKKTASRCLIELFDWTVDPCSEHVRVLNTYFPRILELLRQEEAKYENSPMLSIVSSLTPNNYSTIKDYAKDLVDIFALSNAQKQEMFSHIIVDISSHNAELVLPILDSVTDLGLIEDNVLIILSHVAKLFPGHVKHLLPAIIEFFEKDNTYHSSQFFEGLSVMSPEILVPYLDIFKEKRKLVKDWFEQENLDKCIERILQVK
ncbi:MAG: hypothetical protein ACFFBD_15805, partial [Candidatus Hodarchaeota archaeon]